MLQAAVSRERSDSWEIGGGPDEQRLDGQLLQAETLIFPQVPRLAAEQDVGAKPRHQRGGDADGRFVLGKISDRRGGGSIPADKTD